MASHAILDGDDLHFLYFGIYIFHRFWRSCGDWLADTHVSSSRVVKEWSWCSFQCSADGL